ncbi:hypothetical protein [Candidatus Enterococcus ferrettii]|uniref:Uncharacterized protein n=1 Tax=Candidatus Enterococcus ferrettii TaxID=2815324 RepID=A0ABV0EJW4_9ENTE|nr:hypothetical protein [Enterococcus sp. 665A]MBO1341886.1 hypothetical protein [Enterococcus sp. 665A]
MENVHRNNTNTENKFVEFFEGLDESYQRYLIEEIQKKPPDQLYQKSIDLMCDDIAEFEQRKFNMAGSDGDPKSR